MYFKDDNQVTTTYRPKQLTSYTIDNQLYHTVEYGELKADKIFMLNLVDGGLSIYMWYLDTAGLKLKSHNDTITIDMERKDSDFATNLLAKRHDSHKMVELESVQMALKFKKAMSKLVNDYPELSANIAAKKKGYKLINRDKII